MKFWGKRGATISRQDFVTSMKVFQETPSNNWGLNEEHLDKLFSLCITDSSNKDAVMNLNPDLTKCQCALLFLWLGPAVAAGIHLAGEAVDAIYSFTSRIDHFEGFISRDDVLRKMRKVCLEPFLKTKDPSYRNIEVYRLNEGRVEIVESVPDMNSPISFSDHNIYYMRNLVKSYVPAEFDYPSEEHITHELLFSVAGTTERMLDSTRKARYKWMG